MKNVQEAEVIVFTRFFVKPTVRQDREKHTRRIDNKSDNSLRAVQKNFLMPRAVRTISSTRACED